jgi:hypothetical protein
MPKGKKLQMTGRPGQYLIFLHQHHLGSGNELSLHQHHLGSGNKLS